MLEASVVCLALAMYHEARGEGVIGQVAVGKVVINRATSGDRRWPSTICAVVKQGGPHTRNKCQFSFYCDGRSDYPYDRGAWSNSLAISSWVLHSDLLFSALNGKTCYSTLHTPVPYWAKGPPLELEGHIFYGC